MHLEQERNSEGGGFACEKGVRERKRNNLTFSFLSMSSLYDCSRIFNWAVNSILIKSSKHLPSRKVIGLLGIVQIAQRHISSFDLVVFI